MVVIACSPYRDWFPRAVVINYRVLLLSRGSRGVVRTQTIQILHSVSECDLVEDS